MRNYILGIFITVVGILSSSCKEGRYFAFDDVVYVKNFPAAYSLGAPEIVPIDAIGIQGINVFDDFILLSCVDSGGCLAAFDRDGNPVSTPFLHIGRGPGEVLYHPYMSWFSFSEDRRDTNGGLYDFKGSYLEYDISESLSGGRLSYSCLLDSLSVSDGARYFMATEGSLICRRINQGNDGYERFLVGFNRNEHANIAMSYLNTIRSTEKNLLSTLFLSNREKGIIAELGSRLNVIQLYSLSDGFCRTVAIGERLEDIEKMEILEQDDMSKTYYEAKAFRNFFVGLYLGTTIRELDEDIYSPPELHFFSWEGNPLAKISLPVKALFFDIDVKNKHLYVIDSDTEKILRYDISKFVDLMK